MNTLVIVIYSKGVGCTMTHHTLYTTPRHAHSSRNSLIARGMDDLINSTCITDGSLVLVHYPSIHVANLNSLSISLIFFTKLSHIQGNKAVLDFEVATVLMIYKYLEWLDTVISSGERVIRIG